MKHLEVDEHCVWAGAPRHGIFLRPTDRFMIPSGFLMGTLILVFYLAALDPVFFIFGSPLALFAIYLMFGRFWVDAQIRSRTAYGITNRRVIVSSGFIFREIASLSLNDISELSLQEHPDGRGTISFEGAPRSAEMRLAVPGLYQTGNKIILDHIQQPLHVAGLIWRRMKAAGNKTG
jgi:hypothetical protein